MFPLGEATKIFVLAYTFIAIPTNTKNKLMYNIIILICYSLTWLKKRIKILGLHRRGQRICYTPVGVVKAAIHVSIGILI
jgi:hypothetical protein